MSTWLPAVLSLAGFAILVLGMTWFILIRHADKDPLRLYAENFH